jgi:hypothetical protein
MKEGAPRGPVDHPTWKTYCLTNYAQVPVPSITFSGIVDHSDGTPDANATALILIDHVVPVASCP